LLAALPLSERALWATAFYAGLRRGELMALRWQEVDFEQHLIRVERAWDLREGPKSRAGKRSVPVTSRLREQLIEHRLRDGRSAGLVFGRSATSPFEPVTVAARARRAWQKAGLEPITLHEARHTFASLMIAAGVNAKALSTYLGHASITITLDRYGHSLPGNEDEAADLLERYLRSAETTGAR
jgi:integrase